MEENATLENSPQLHKKKVRVSSLCSERSFVGQCLSFFCEVERFEWRKVEEEEEVEEEVEEEELWPRIRIF